MMFDIWHKGVDLDIYSQDFQLSIIEDYDDEDKEGKYTTYSVALMEEDTVSPRYSRKVVCRFSEFKTYEEASKYLDDLKRLMERR